MCHCLTLSGVEQSVTMRDYAPTLIGLSADLCLRPVRLSSDKALARNVDDIDRDSDNETGVDKCQVTFDIGGVARDDTVDGVGR